jgi:dual specificity MAP kinase phosphatase
MLIQVIEILLCHSCYKQANILHIFTGGLKEFVQKHKNLCESMCHAPKREHTEYETLVGATRKLSTEGPIEKQCNGGVASGPPVSEIIPRLFIGNKISASDESLINKLDIKYILNVTKDHPNYFQHRSDLIYKQISVNDSSQEDIGMHFEDALKFIGENQITLLSILATIGTSFKLTKLHLFLDEGRKKGKGVLVHCQAGISRSATVVIAFLMKHEKMTLNDAYKLVKEKRPVISPNLNFMGSLLKFEKTSFRC